MKTKNKSKLIIIGMILLVVIISLTLTFNSKKIDGLILGVDAECYKNITKTYCDDNNFKLVSEENIIVCNPINSIKTQNDVNIEIERIAEAQC